MRRNFGSALLCAAWLAAPPALGAEARPAPAEIRVLSYNIHYGVPDLERVAAVICGTGADIVGLQEVDVHWSERSGFADQAAHIARACGMEYRYAPIYSLPPLESGRPPRQFGVALLSRHPIVAFENRLLTRLSTQADAAPAPMPGFLQATVEVAGRRVDVFVTHLDYRPDPAVRRTQVAEMLAIIGAPARPTILLGDMNAPPEAEELAPLRSRLRDAWSVNADPGWTFPADSPARRIDYVLVGGPVTVSSARVLEAVTSDHRAVMAELVLSAAASQPARLPAPSILSGLPAGLAGIALEPRGPPEVAERAGARGDALRGEVPGLGPLRSGGIEADVALETEQRLYLRVRLHDAVHDGLPGLTGDGAGGPAHPGVHVLGPDVRLDEVALEAAVEGGIGGVPLRVRVIGVPAVMVPGGVVRVGGVHDVVAEDAGVVDDALLDPAPLLAGRRGAPEPPLGHQPLIQLERAIGQQPDVAQVVRRPAGGVQRVHEAEAVRCVQCQAGDVLEPQVMVV